MTWSWFVLEYTYDEQIRTVHRLTGPFTSARQASDYKDTFKCHDIIALEAPLETA